MSALGSACNVFLLNGGEGDSICHKTPGLLGILEN